MLIDGTPEETSLPTSEVTTPEAPAEPIPAQKDDRTFTRDEVTQILTKRLQRANNAMYKRIGVENEQALTDYLNNHKSMLEELEKLRFSNSELSRTNSFLKNNVNPDKYDDIVAHFKGSGVDFSEDELLKLLTTHPEWLNKPVEPVVSTTTIKTLSPERGHQVVETEDEKMKRIFGV